MMIKDRINCLKERITELHDNPKTLSEDDIYGVLQCLDKQIPMKPIIDGRHYECPYCGGWLMFNYESHEGVNYCSKCSQALNWKGITAQ